MAILIQLILLALLIYSTIFTLKICDTYHTVQNKHDYTSKVKFLFYNGHFSDQYVVMNFTQLKNLVHMSSFNPKKITVLYTGGLNQPNNDPEILRVIDGYLTRREKYNVIEVGWEEFNNISLERDKVIEHLFNIGQLIAHELDQLVNNGVSAKNIHLVGASMGAQMSGAIGRKMLYKPSLIVGLDPARRSFEIDKPHLTIGDGECVISMHTDMGLIGSNLTDVNVNYYINKGQVPQPGCESSKNQSMCGHKLAPRVWSEILKHPRLFLGRRCESFEKLQKGDCSNEPVVQITPYTTDISGSFFFKTAPELPYGLGEDGT